MTFQRGEPITYAGGDSASYKKQIEQQLKLEGADSIVSHAIRGQRTPFGVASRRAETYTQLSNAIDAIDNGPTTSNAPPLDVRRASADLVESCRKRLVELDTESEKQGYTAQNQKEREDIFALLEEIRVANAREKNWQWASDFTSSMARQVYEGLSWAYANKLTLLTCGVLAGVAAAFALPALLMLGPIGWGALAVAALSFIGYLFYKIGSVIGTAYREANEKALNEKMGAGDAILKAAQETAKGELEDATATHDKAKEALKAATDNYEKISNDMENFLKDSQNKIEKISTEIKELDSSTESLQTEILRDKAALEKYQEIQQGRGLTDQEKLDFMQAEAILLPSETVEGGLELQNLTQGEKNQSNSRESAQETIEPLTKVQHPRSLTEEETRTRIECEKRLITNTDQLQIIQTTISQKEKDRDQLRTDITNKTAEFKQAGDNLTKARTALPQAKEKQKAALAKSEASTQRVNKQAPAALSPISKAAQNRSIETKNKQSALPKANTTPMNNRRKGPNAT